MTLEDPTKVLILGDEPRIAARSESEQGTIVLYGSPSIGGHTNFDAVTLGDLARDPVGGARQLNGEFVTLIESADHVTVVSDRFAAQPLFYLVDDSGLVISFSYQAIWRWLSDHNRLNIDPLAFYEFLHFQRLFGTTTFDLSTSVLPPASVLTFEKSARNFKIRRYWTPDFGKRLDGRRAVARDLADAVRRSVAVKTAGSNNISLFLSGGMDSRVVLGGFPNNVLPACITVGESENNEVDVARSLAAAVGAKHFFVERPSTHYADIVSESTSTGGGMYSFQHGHFFNLDIPETDLILHGHGFDYFFQGIYLPSRRKRMMGRPTRRWALESIGPDLIGQYLSEAKYRLKGVDALNLLNPAVYSDAIDRLRADLGTVLEPIDWYAVDSYDKWDYLTTSAPGRHYTYLNLLSAGSLAEQRTIAFDNDIFDIYYSTPADVRHGTTLLAETIRHLNSRLLEVRNANTNLRPDLSPLRLTVSSWTRGARRRMGVGNSLRPDPGIGDRSWPSGDDLLRRSHTLQERVNALRHSERLEGLKIFDHSKLENMIDTFHSGNRSVSPALLTLITIDTFLATASW